jgi:hypothetical protein
MKTQLVYKLIFLGFMALFMNLGKLCANDVSQNTDFSKNSTLKIYSFVTNNALNNTPLIVENDLEYNDSQTFQQNPVSSDNTTQSFYLLFGYNNYFSKKIVICHLLLHFPIKRYLLNCIFLI